MSKVEVQDYNLSELQDLKEEADAGYWDSH